MLQSSFATRPLMTRIAPSLGDTAYDTVYDAVQAVGARKSHRKPKPLGLWLGLAAAAGLCIAGVSWGFYWLRPAPEPYRPKQLGAAAAFPQKCDPCTSGAGGPAWQQADSRTAIR